MADRRNHSLLVAAATQHHQRIMVLTLIFLQCLAAAATSAPSQIITYPQMGIALLEMLNSAPDVVWKNLFSNRSTYFLPIRGVVGNQYGAWKSNRVTITAQNGNIFLGGRAWISDSNSWSICRLFMGFNSPVSIN